MYKALLIFGLLVSTNLPAFAGNVEKGEAIHVICKAGDLLTIEGEIRDLIFDATVTVTLNGTPWVHAEHLSYKRSQNDSSSYYRLVVNDAAKAQAFENVFFVPEGIEISSSPRGIFLWLPM